MGNFIGAVEQVDERQHADHGQISRQDQQLREQTAARIPEGTRGSAVGLRCASARQDSPAQTDRFAQVRPPHRERGLHHHRPAEEGAAQQRFIREDGVACAKERDAGQGDDCASYLSLCSQL